MKTAAGFDVEAAAKQLAEFRAHILVLDAMYVFMVMFGKKRLSNVTSNKLLLQDLSLLWNSFNAVISFVIAVLTFPDFVYSVFQGWHYMVCNVGTFMTDRYSGLGEYMFVISKIWELGDTVILMLRGRPVIFLHSYHHAIVLLQTWLTYPHVGSFARLGTFMNAVVHSVMYSYFAITSLFPSFRRFNVVVTIAQLTQFFVAVLGICYGQYAIRSGKHCDSDPFFANVHLMIYVSFMILFGHFFYVNYVQKQQQNQKRTKKQD